MKKRTLSTDISKPIFDEENCLNGWEYIYGTFTYKINPFLEISIFHTQEGDRSAYGVEINGRKKSKTYFSKKDVLTAVFNDMQKFASDIQKFIETQRK